MAIACGPRPAWWTRAWQLRADLGLTGSALTRIVPRLSELLPDLAAPPTLQPDEERFRLLDAAAQFFTAVSAREAVLLILDDLQWADAGTAMMMRHVARGCADRRLLMAGAYRTTEVMAQDPLADVLGAVQAETECTVIRLRALGPEAIGQLVAAQAGVPVSSSLITAIAAHTGGNPFFAKEMIRHLLEEGALAEDSSGALEASLPLVAVLEGVRQVVARRCARLPARANRLAESASGFARAPMSAGCARTAAHLGQPERAMALLALPVRALARAPAWALNYTRTASDTAETLWVLDRRDHLRSAETALRLKALPPDFRFLMMDLRLSLARLCAVDGRPDEAAHWFRQACAALEEQEARPLRAITDFDQALMHARLGRYASARRLLEAAAGQFQRIAMTGWLRRAEQLAGTLS